MPWMRREHPLHRTTRSFATQDSNTLLARPQKEQRSASDASRGRVSATQRLHRTTPAASFTKEISNSSLWRAQTEQTLGAPKERASAMQSSQKTRPCRTAASNGSSSRPQNEHGPSERASGSAGASARQRLQTTAS